MNSAGSDATAINAADGTVAGTIALDGQPEFVVSDGKGKIFVNITDKSQIVEVAGQTSSSTTTAAASATSPGIRLANGLFSSCEKRSHTTPLPGFSSLIAMAIWHGSSGSSPVDEDPRGPHPGTSGGYDVGDISSSIKRERI
jgi:hypothetical protein